MRRSLIWSLLFVFVVAAGSITATLLSGHSILLGLDLRGGVSVVLQPQGTANSAELNQAVSIIERRVNGLGVSNSNVARQGSDVVIDLPGLKNSQQALAQLGQTAVLYFRPVDCLIPAYVAPGKSTSTTTTTPKSASSTTVAPAKVSPGTTSSPATTARSGLGVSQPAHLTSAFVAAGSTSTSTSTSKSSATTTKAAPGTTTAPTTTPTPTTTTTLPPGAVNAATACSSTNPSSIPTTTPAQDVPSASVVLPVDPAAFASSPTVRYVLGPADMAGSVISNAVAEINSTTGQYTVALTLTSKGAVKFDSIAAARYACYQQSPTNPPPCSEEAFELDGLVESAPDFQASSFNGNVSISGNFTSAQATALANELKYGSLPVRFVPQTVQTISATIGKDSLRAGLLAGLGGILVVMVYMLLYYRALGLVVMIGLGVGGSILYSILAELSQTSNLTLTLAGVTGIIVSIGITVDSYVVYFERLKDEVRAGRTVRQSVERSFARAFRTVLTADLVSFLAALVLYLLTIGSVRGFAFTLGLSTLLDVFTAFFFIRPAVIWVGRRRSITDNPVFGIARGLGAKARG